MEDDGVATNTGLIATKPLPPLRQYITKPPKRSDVPLTVGLTGFHRLINVRKDMTAIIRDHG